MFSPQYSTRHHFVAPSRPVIEVESCYESDARKRLLSMSSVARIFWNGYGDKVGSGDPADIVIFALGWCV